MNNKKHLALAISAIIFSGAANAALDMNDVTADAATFASEIDIAVAPAVTTLANAGSIFDVTNDLGFGMSNGAVRYVRYDLDNGAEFNTPVTDAELTIATANVSVSSGGGLGDAFIVFQITATADLPVDHDMTLAIPDINIIGQTTVNIEYNHFEFAANAVANTSPLATSSEDIITFAPSLALVCTPNTAASFDQIDVGQSSLLFDGGVSDTDTQIGSFQVLFTQHLNVAGALIADADAIIDPTATSLTLSGSNGWSAIAAAGGTLVDSAASGTYAVVSGDYVEAAAPLSDYSAALDFTADTAGTVPLVASEITVTVSPVAMAGYTATTAMGSCVLGEMTKNGSQDRLTFLLKPNAGFKNFVRVTNPSSTDGNVFLTITDDDGAMAAIALSDVAGQPASLVAGASTDLININDLATAAVAANAAFDVSGKMRLDVDAEFGVTGQTTGVNVQAFSMSKDSNSFFMLNPE